MSMNKKTAVLASMALLFSSAATTTIAAPTQCIAFNNQTGGSVVIASAAGNQLFQLSKGQAPTVAIEIVPSMEPFKIFAQSNGVLSPLGTVQLPLDNPQPPYMLQYGVLAGTFKLSPLYAAQHQAKGYIPECHQQYFTLTLALNSSAA